MSVGNQAVAQQIAQQISYFSSSRSRFHRDAKSAPELGTATAADSGTMWLDFPEFREISMHAGGRLKGKQPHRMFPPSTIPNAAELRTALRPRFHPRRLTSHTMRPHDHDGDSASRREPMEPVDRLEIFRSRNVAHGRLNQSWQVGVRWEFLH